MRLKPTDKSYKVIAEGKKGNVVHVFCIRKMDGVYVLTKSQIQEMQQDSES
jgi:hypothetical protein